VTLSEDVFFNKVTIIGVGLIGASFALALREKGLSRIITGCGRTEAHLWEAKARGIIDDYSTKVEDVCENSDLILLSTPVSAFKEIAKRMGGSVRSGSLVTDVGSVKGRLVHEMESLMPPGINFVGSHPIAGSDKSGIDDARAGLFHDARCVVTPTEKTNRDAQERIVSLWEKLGSRVEVMDPYEHDEIYGAVSHLPHVVAYALVNAVNEFREGCLRYAGQGFKDTTRIALSSAEIWRDISIYNKGNLIKQLGILRKHLEGIEELLRSEDGPGIEREFLKARKLRMGLSDGGWSMGHALPEVETSEDSTSADQGL
jgi:prephenate dehydrogenase